MSPLKKEVGFLSATAYGVGIIVGAGIYAIIGRATGYAGDAIWISFILASAIAALTGLSYAELSSMFPDSSAEYAYIKKSSGSNFLAFIIGWLVLLSGILSGSAVALGFGGYFEQFIALPSIITGIILIVLLSLLNLLGIKETLWANILMTATEVTGLIIVIVLGLRFFGSVNYFEAPSGFQGVLTAAALVFFAFIGFESLPKISEETKNPTKTIPKALLASLAISTVLFVLVAISVVSVVPYTQLAASPAPLTDVVLAASGPEVAFVLSVIALFATANTVLITLTASSRIAYGMSVDSSLPKIFSRILSSRGTPWVSTLIIMAISIAFTLLGDIALVASITNAMIFIVFISINLALIYLCKTKKCQKKDVFRTPFRIKNIPITAVLGAFSSAFMLVQFNFVELGIAFAIAGLGGLIYLLQNKITHIHLKKLNKKQGNN